MVIVKLFGIVSCSFGRQNDNFSINSVKLLTAGRGQRVIEIKSVYVFIHGAWQSRLIFDSLLLCLKAKGLEAYAIDLPGHGENIKDFSKVTLKTYVHYVVNFLKALPSTSNVVLVGHSMAGMVISEVAQRVCLQKLIYIAAYLPRSGDSLLGIAERFNENGLSDFMVFDIPNNVITLKKRGLEGVLYNDCDAGVWKRALMQLQPQPAMPFSGKVGLGEQFDAVEKEYIVCLKDQVISPVAQRSMCQIPRCKILELNAGHEAMLSMPDELSRFFP